MVLSFWLFSPSLVLSEVVPIYAQTCATQSIQTSQNTFNLPCLGSYPAPCNSSGDYLGCDDTSEEIGLSWRFGNTSYYGGVNASYFNSTLTDCTSITSVNLCYKWWGSSSSHTCTVAVDRDSGLSWSTVSPTCENSEPSSLTCVDVTSLEAWTCADFFTTTATTLAKMQALKTGGTGFTIWNFDVLYFNVTYSNFSDGEAPSFANLTAAPANNTAYDLTQIFTFNITWTDNMQVDAVSITFDGINYSTADNSITNMSDVYTFTRVGLAAGEHTYQWFANDSSDNVNQTPLQSSTVALAIPLLNLTLDDNASNLTVQPNSMVNITATLALGEGFLQLLVDELLYQQGTGVLSNLTLFSTIGTFNVTAFAPATENFTDGFTTLFVTTQDMIAPVIQLGVCLPNPSTIGEDVTCNATITDDVQVNTVVVNLTLPDATVVSPLVVNVSDDYLFTYNASQLGNVSVLWIANDSSGNEAQDSSQQYIILAANQSSGSGSSGGGSSGSSSSNLGSDSGPGALRNAPPGTAVIGNQPLPRQSSPSPSPSEGAPTTQQPSATGETTPLTGAAVGQQDAGVTFKKVTLIFLLVALLFFVVSYILRERRVTTKHLYSNKRPQKSMVKNPDVLDKLQGYVSAEILDRLKKGDHLQHKRIDPRDKEFAHHFPETAKELQEKKISVRPKKFDYERLEQVKRDITKENKVISASDMKKLFPETLGRAPKLQQETFILTPRTKEVVAKVGEDDFSKHYILKQPEKLARTEPKQALHTNRKINKTSKDKVLKGLQEVYKIE